MCVQQHPQRERASWRWVPSAPHGRRCLNNQHDPEVDRRKLTKLGRQLSVTALVGLTGFSQELRADVLKDLPSDSACAGHCQENPGHLRATPMGEELSRILPPHRRALCGTVGSTRAPRLSEPSTLLTAQRHSFLGGFIDSTAFPASSAVAEPDSAQEIALSGVLLSISVGELPAPPTARFSEVSTFPAPSAAAASVRAGSPVCARER